MKVKISLSHEQLQQLGIDIGIVSLSEKWKAFKHINKEEDGNVGRVPSADLSSLKV